MDDALKMDNQLNNEQKIIVDKNLYAARNKTHIPNCIFIKGQEGSGKTYLYETVYHIQWSLVISGFVIRGLPLYAVCQMFATTCIRGKRNSYPRKKLCQCSLFT